MEHLILALNLNYMEAEFLYDVPDVLYKFRPWKVIIPRRCYSEGSYFLVPMPISTTLLMVASRSNTILKNYTNRFDCSAKIAGAVAYLYGPYADYIGGALIRVDGSEFGAFNATGLKRWSSRR